VPAIYTKFNLNPTFIYKSISHAFVLENLVHGSRILALEQH